MTDREILHFLATKLMGWDRPLHKTVWNPLENANHCLGCVKKLGELGLGGKYVYLLEQSLGQEGILKNDGFDNYGINEDALYAFITLSLKTQCEAMVEVLKEAKAGKENDETRKSQNV